MSNQISKLFCCAFTSIQAFFNRFEFVTKIVSTPLAFVCLAVPMSSSVWAHSIVAARVAGMVPQSIVAATPELNQYGLSGSWYEQATSGQGFEIEVFPNLISAGTAFVFVSWFTYDYTETGGADHQRWYTMGGNAVSGAPSISLGIYQNIGGVFNALPVTKASQVGTATLSFSSCDEATMDYLFSDGTGRHDSIPIKRILANVTCATQSPPSTDADFALSGNWYAPALGGQGISVEINPVSSAAFFAWYTYAAAGAPTDGSGQRWYTGSTMYTAGNRTLALPLYETTGGLFDSPTAATQRTIQVGSATLAYQSCTAATLSFNMTGGSNAGAMGTIALSRVGSTPPGCAEASTAEGYWSGQVGNNSIRAIILNDGTFYIVYTQAGVDTQVVQGTSTAIDGVLTSADARTFPIATQQEHGISSTPAQIEGTYVAKSSLQLTIARSTGTDTLTAMYDEKYDRPAGLAAAAGTYYGYSGHTTGRISAVFFLDTAGNLLGANGACKFSGKITPRSSTNVFDFSVQSRDHTGCIFGIAPITGIMYYDETTGTIRGFAPYSARADEFFLIGSRN